jgi:hypothetical protein
MLRGKVRVFGALFLGVITCAQPQRASADGELRIISRSSLVFVDAVREGERGAEWAPYRVVEEQRPVIFKVDGPGRLVLKLRSFLEATKRESIGVVLRDDTIVLTARVPGVRDPDVKLVEGGKKRATKARTYVVRVERGEHTISVRFSEGPSLLVYARFIAGEQREIDAGIEGEVPLVDPRVNPPPNEIERVGRVTVQGDRVAEGTEAPVETVVQAEPSPLASPETWEKKAETQPADLSSRSGPDLETPASEGLLPVRTFVPREERTLTQPVPFLSFELRGGVLGSRFGLDIAPVFGADARIPIPQIDARRFTLGAAIDGSYARGQAPVIDGGTGAAVGIAKISRSTIDVAGDVRFVIARILDVFDPYVSLGAGASFRSQEAETSGRIAKSSNVSPIGVLRVGAAFGELGSRPFLEARGAIAEDDAMISMVIGYRFELIGEARAD